MRVLIDTNIVLDYLLERELFIKDARDLFEVILVLSVRQMLEQLE